MQENNPNNNKPKLTLNSSKNKSANELITPIPVTQKDIIASGTGNDLNIISKKSSMSIKDSSIPDNQFNESKNNKSSPIPAKKKMLLKPEKVEKIMQYLRDTYSNCFTNPVSPLALKIHRQLWEKEISKEGSLVKNKKTIGTILKIYTGRREYKNSLILGALRLNLDGTSSSSVTEKEIPSNYLNKNKAKNLPEHSSVTIDNPNFDV